MYYRYKRKTAKNEKDRERGGINLGIKLDGITKKYAYALKGSENSSQTKTRLLDTKNGSNPLS